MKKWILSFAVIAILVTVLKTSAYSQRFTAGGKIGLGLSRLSNWDYRSSESEDNQRSTLAGLQVSLIGKYKINKLLGLQAELQYIQKGEGKENTGSPEIPYKAKLRLKYLTLPLMATVTHSFGKIVVYGNLGLYFGYATGAVTVVKEPIESKTSKFFGDGALRGFDMGLCIGAAAGYPFGPGNIIFDIRYDLGFIDIYRTPDRLQGTNYKATCNRTFGMAVGYLIPLGKH
ncbi:MAG: porin family protein [Prolixibacteraceae bacterium]